MLSSLHIRNLAIVEDLRVECRPGLNVITGETGAGKSIIVGALSLLLGERADRSMLRSGEEQGSVEAVFQLGDSADVDAVLQEAGLPACEGGNLLLRRVIAASGGGKNWINDSAASVQTLKKIGDRLVDMHGPHDHQSILHPEVQLNILDFFARLQKDRDAYGTVYREWLDLVQKRKELDADDETVAQQIDLLSYQVKEIEDAQVKENEDAEVEQELTTVSHAERVRELSQGLQQALTEQDTSAFQGLVTAQKHLAELAGLTAKAAEWREEASSLAVRVQELSVEISRTLDGVESDPKRLQWLEDRLAVLSRLKRKYGGSLPAVFAKLSAAKEKLHGLLSRGEVLAELDAQLEQAKKKVLAAGKKLSRARQEACVSLAKAITAELRGLGFPHGAFEAKLAPAEPGPLGCDQLEFGFAPNAGEAMRPLALIASSGEISRVMLAVKTILARHDRIPVLVFDEIDSNVGGEMGTAIGERLAAISEHHQVLCITHFPQVAVFGRTHFVVSKEVRGGRTRTRISPLEDESRAEEIARMLGGRDLTSVALRHAEEMLKKRKLPDGH